jgi:hypothetical protein
MAMCEASVTSSVASSIVSTYGRPPPFNPAVSSPPCCRHSPGIVGIQSHAQELWAWL